MSESKADAPGSDSSTKPDVATSNEHVTAAVDDVPDPDEDDLDDLDDMLEEFSTVKIDSTKPAAAAPKPEKPSTSKATASKPAIPMIPTLTTDVPAIDPNDFSDEEFQRQLQAGMAELMGDLDSNVSLLPRKPKRCMIFSHRSSPKCKPSLTPYSKNSAPLQLWARNQSPNPPPPPPP